MGETGLTKRDFLRATGLVFASLSVTPFIQACATIGTQKDWTSIPVEEFDIDAFHDRYVSKYLYNKNNPNLQLSHKTHSKFRTNFYHGTSSGITYRVAPGTTVTASAPGKVYSIEKETQPIGDTSNRSSDMVVVITHPSYTNPVKTYYHNLNMIDASIHQGKKIKRGDPIGKVYKGARWFKPMLTLELFGGASWVDPDNYGQYHSYMQYADRPLGQDNIKYNDPEMTEQRWTKQLESISNITSFDEYGKIPRHKMTHFSGRYKSNSWAPIEKMRYLEKLYRVNPNIFPGLSRNQFELIRMEFYSNQPVILTLPFKKRNKKLVWRRI